ncbi:Kinase, NEK [Giardia muris]|uniref:Kinase, NEK n=1 Tax=Giardia muris TaxID=5742 RepID=A0A4Z1SN41_GIAMU|nr:Kinase, NEK [Giardia muris]|eukprot:TNJ27126.1 Kinase, NEK [Giardia muris]
MTNLIEAAKDGDLGRVYELIREAGGRDDCGMTALMHAAAMGRCTVVRVLTPRESRLQDGSGWTALMHAVEHCHVDCVRLLVSELDLKTPEGEDAYAVLQHKSDVSGSKLKDKLIYIREVLRLTPVLPSLPDALQGRYKLTGPLGWGGLGHVFSARSEAGNCAIKVVDLHVLPGEGKRSIASELQTLPHLHHEYLLKYHEIYEDIETDEVYFVMDWCVNTLQNELDIRVKLKQSFSDDEVWKFVAQLASGLSYLHEEGYLHRDLKPEHIFLTDTMDCCIAGFTLSTRMKPGELAHTFCGSLLLMAPEFFEEQMECRAPVDIWALGVTAYQLCTQTLPFRCVSEVQTIDPPKIKGRPQSLIALIERMLSKSPTARPTAQEVFDEARCHLDQ